VFVFVAHGCVGVMELRDQTKTKME
jgi:hypothetical protein